LWDAAKAQLSSDENDRNRLPSSISAKRTAYHLVSAIAERAGGSNKGGFPTCVSFGSTRHHHGCCKARDCSRRRSGASVSKPLPVKYECGYPAQIDLVLCRRVRSAVQRPTLLQRMSRTASLRPRLPPYLVSCPLYGCQCSGCVIVARAV
jgi:hypothetical protein